MFLGTIVGNLGRNAEMVTSKAGRQLIKISLGVNMGKEHPTVWIGVLMPDNPNLMPYLLKGTQLLVTGRVTIDYNRGYLDINMFADQVQLLASKLYQEVQNNGPQPGVPAQVQEPTTPPTNTNTISPAEAYEQTLKSNGAPF